MCALFTQSHCFFCGFSFGDIEKSNHSADSLALANKWVRPILDGKTATVLSPKNIVVNMDATIFKEAHKNGTLVYRKGCAVLSRMVFECMHVLADQLLSTVVAD